MSFLLDTDICSAHFKGDRQVWQKAMQHGGQLNISAITVGELSTWASRQGVSAKRRQVLKDFLKIVNVLDVAQIVGEKIEKIRAAMIDTGQRPPDFDLLIAATALVHNLTLVTHNTKDFTNIAGLRLDDWIVP